MHNYNETLAARWPKRNTDRLSRLRKHFDGIIEAPIRISERKATWAKDKHLSAEGVRSRVRDLANGEVAPAMVKAGYAAEAARKQIDAEIRGLRPKKPDPADIAGAFLRAQIRSSLIEKGPLAAKSFLMDQAVDPAVLEAVFEAPPWLLGLTNADLDQIADVNAKLTHPDILAIAEDEREAAVLLDNAVHFVREAIKEHGFALDRTGASAEFAAWMEKVTSTNPPEPEDYADSWSSEDVLDKLFALPRSRREAFKMMVTDREFEFMKNSTGAEYIADFDS